MKNDKAFNTTMNLPYPKQDNPMSDSGLKLSEETEREARERLAAHCDYQVESHEHMARAFPRQAAHHREQAAQFRTRAASLRSGSHA